MKRLMCILMVMAGCGAGDRSPEIREVVDWFGGYDMERGPEAVHACWFPQHGPWQTFYDCTQANLEALELCRECCWTSVCVAQQCTREFLIAMDWCPTNDLSPKVVDPEPWTPWPSPPDVTHRGCIDEAGQARDECFLGCALLEPECVDDCWKDFWLDVKNCPVERVEP